MPEPVDPKFWNRIAPKYSKQPIANEAAYRKTLERSQYFLQGARRVLEVGCGTGSTALKLSSCAESILATDVSEAMVGIARKKALEQGVENVTFLAGTLDETSLQERSFDGVLAFNLFHLLSDVPEKLARVHELLRPGGVFLSKTPCLGDDSVVIRWMIPVLRKLGKAPYVNFLRADELGQAIRRAGFEVVETGVHAGKGHSFFIAARKKPQ